MSYFVQQVFDAAFDRMNSHCPHAAGSKSPLREGNMSEKMEFLEQAVSYMKEIKDTTGSKLITGNK